MKLASVISVEIGGEEIVLRPSLSRALVLFRRHDLKSLVKGVTEGSLTLACELIEPHSSRLTTPTVFRRDLIEAGLDKLATPLLEYVAALAGIDPDAEPQPEKGKGKPAPVNQEQNAIALYRIGTGWLGWTPAATLDAAPAEIIEAYTGRLDMLKALFGSGEEKPKATPANPDQLTAKFKFLFGARARKGA